MQNNNKLNKIYLARLKAKRKEFDKHYELYPIPQNSNPNFYRVIRGENINCAQAKDLAFYLTLTADEKTMYTYLLVQKSFESYKKYCQLTKALNSAGSCWLSAVISVEQYLDKIEQSIKDLRDNHDLTLNKKCLDIWENLELMRSKLKKFEQTTPQKIWREINKPNDQHTTERYEISDILRDIYTQSDNLMNACIKLDNISALNDEFYIQNRVWGEKLLSAQKIEPELSKFLRKPKKRVDKCFKRIHNIEYSLEVLSNEHKLDFQY